MMVYFFACMLLAITIVYIQDLHSNLTTVNADNLKLLNGMHEGLLILSKDEENRQIMFCNATVKKLIQNFALIDHSGNS